MAIRALRFSGQSEKAHKVFVIRERWKDFKRNVPTGNFFFSSNFTRVQKGSLLRCRRGGVKVLKLGEHPELRSVFSSPHFISTQHLRFLMSHEGSLKDGTQASSVSQHGGCKLDQAITSSRSCFFSEWMDDDEGWWRDDWRMMGGMIDGGMDGWSRF